MERSFYNEDYDFEQLIKQKSDQYKIYPSEKVWRGVYGSLHSKRKWYWLSFVLFIAGISYYTIEQLATPVRRVIANNKENSSRKPESNTQAGEAIVLPFTPPSIYFTKDKKPSNYKQKGLVIAMNELGIDNSAVPPAVDAVSYDLPETVQASIPLKRDGNMLIADKDIAVAAVASIRKEEFAAVTSEKNDAVLELAENISDKSSEDELVASNDELGDEKRINWLQENAVYELTRPKLKRVSWMATLTPTMNYRRLVGNKDASLPSDVKNIPIALNIQGDVENLVNHKPALGFEAGGGFLYAVNKNVTFKTGILFNYSRYNIEAFSSYTNEIATIALSNFYGANTDSLLSLTRLRNFGGNSAKNLKNEYFQLSAPIGVEVLVLGKGKLQVSVAGTVQPTYLLNRDSYLITTDYKNYTKEPSLVRRWNVNTSAEAFLAYKAGNGFRFQLGPQVRYQLLSTYSDKYPIREFLLEYGIKLGVSKTIR